jgi:hypothetical protein
LPEGWNIQSLKVQSLEGEKTPTLAVVDGVGSMLIESRTPYWITKIHHK